jgi:replicative DNA helicase
MKRIFRSIINIKKDGNPTIPLNELEINYTAFVKSKIKAEDSAELIYHWIEAHHREYKEVPSFELILEKAKLEGNEVILANLREIAIQLPYTRSDFLAILKEKYEEQCNGEFKGILNKTWEVTTSGIDVKEKRRTRKLKGLRAAIEYFTSNVRKFRKEGIQLKIEGCIRSEEDRKEVVDGYLKRKRDPTAANDGLYTFLDKIDDVFKGVKLGDLFIVAAFVGQGKSTFTANMTYNAVCQGMNGVFFTLEMTFDEMRTIFYVLHTTNPDWYNHSVYGQKYKHLVGKISYDKVRYGELSDEEQEFFEVASADFRNREDFGELFIIQPPDQLTPSYLEMELYDKKAQLSEMEDGVKNIKLDFCVIDYIGLMAQDKEERYGDFNVDLNSIIKKLKNLAITFDNGAALRIITPFQVNREGWKEAAKNDGVYRLTALSNANESERAADHVITLYMTDEMKKAGIVKITCLKHRRGADFAPFEAHIDLACSKRVRDVIDILGDPTREGAFNVSEIVGL